MHRTISAIRPVSWETINRALIAAAQQEKLEAGAMVRIDSTVTAALMHAPSDSALLWDRAADDTVAAPGRGIAGSAGNALARPSEDGQTLRHRDPIQPWQTHPAPALRKLIAATHAIRAALQRVAKRLGEVTGLATERWRARVDHYLPLIARVLDQSERRVLRGQVVPTGDKLDV